MGVRLPAEYQEVEYLQSAGAQYINTRINVRSGLKTIAKVELTSVDRVQYICGGYTASPRVYFSPFYCRSNNTVGCAYNTTEFPSNYTLTAKTPYFIESILSNGTQSLKINGELAISGQVEGAFEANWPIWIFANNNSNSSYRRFAFAKISLFELIDSDSNEVIRKFIPCYRKSDNEPGMYDLVSGEFYTNAGTGEFTVGPDVIDSISPWLVARRRLLMQQEPELYPVGTNLVATYAVNWVDNYAYRDNGTTTYVSGMSRCSDYFPINPKYTYQKSGHRLCTYCCWYDADKQFISAFAQNNTIVQNITNIPENARFMRITTQINSKTSLRIIRTA